MNRLNCIPILNQRDRREVHNIYLGGYSVGTHDRAARQSAHTRVADKRTTAISVARHEKDGPRFP